MKNETKTYWPFPLERAIITLALVSYASIVAYVIPRHEPWADEAQAWQLAKYLSLAKLFGTYIHYEASPGLWHAFLWLLARLHITYSGMHWVSGLIAFGTVILLMVASPFPLPVRISLPFTYFFVYQYAIIARSYVLFPLILFALACIWRHRLERPLFIAFLIGLLANVSLHGFAVSAGLALVLAVEWIRLPKNAAWSPRKFAASASLLLIMMGFAAWSTFPAADAGWVYAAHQKVEDDSSSLRASLIAQEHPWLAPFPHRARVFAAETVGILHAFRHGLADRAQLGLVLWLLLFLGFLQKRCLRYCLPAFLLALATPPQAYHIYHAGLMWILFLFLWWATWNLQATNSPIRWPEFSRWLHLSLVAGVLLCIAIQLWWSWRAIRYDVRNSYSASRDGSVILRDYMDSGQRIDLAVPLKTNDRDGTAEAYVVGLEPYFDAEPIANMPNRFWFWGGDQEMRRNYLHDLAQNRPVVLVEEDDEDPRYHAEENQLLSFGYNRDKVVCGSVFYPDGMGIPLCHVFYRPSQNSESTQ